MMAGKKGARASKEPSKTTPRIARSNEHTRCQEEAWRLLCEGVWTYSGIAAGVNRATGCKHDHHWARRNLERYSARVAEVVDNGAINARAEYMQGLRYDLTAQASIANMPTASERDRIAARKAMTEIREKLAAARGVVTDRKAIAVTGEIETTFRVVIGGVPEDDGDRVPASQPDAG